MKILWITNIPSPYRVDFFNELGKECELTVLFERKDSNERDVSWSHYQFSNFNGIIMKSIKYTTDSGLSFNQFKYIKNKFDHIIISNPFTTTGMITITFLKLNRIPYHIVSDGGIPKEGESLKEKFKKFILTGAKLYFSTAEIHDKYYLKYGAKQEQIVRYPFTSLKEIDIIKEVLTRKEKENKKKCLGIKEKKVIISVGRFHQEKGLDILLKASKGLDDDIAVYIIGGKPTQEYLKIVADYDLKNIVFLDFMNKEKLFEYFKAADVFVLPTRGDVWGLVINEAMANGLPIITTDKCVAGLELIKNDFNGYIVPVDNKKALNEKIKLLINDNDSLKRMGKNNIAKITSYTIEKMATDHINIFRESLNHGENKSRK